MHDVVKGHQEIFQSCLGGNGWTFENSGGAEARKPEGQPDDTRHGEQKGILRW